MEVTVDASAQAEQASTPRRRGVSAAEAEVEVPEPVTGDDRAVPIEIVDEVSRSAAADVSISIRRNAAKGSQTVETLDLGKSVDAGIVISSTTPLAGDVVIYEAGRRFGYARGEIRLDEIRTDGASRTARIELPLLAGITVDLSAASLRLDEAVISVTPIPDLSKLSISDPKELRALRMLQVDPEALMESLEKRGAILFSFREVAAVRDHESSADLFVPWDGEVRVSARQRKMTMAVASAVVARGTSIRVSLAMVRPPVVRGVVLDPDGNPLPGREVVIRAHSEFKFGEILPRSHDDDKREGIVFTLEKPDLDCPTRVFVKRHPTTDATGRFEVEIAFTDGIAAWCFDPTFGVGYAKAVSASRTSDCRALVVRCPGIPAGDHRCRVIGPAGYPATDRTFMIHEVPTSDDRRRDSASDFSLEYPPMTTGADGWMDCRYLQLGRSYCLTERGGRSQRTTFIYRPGGDIQQ